VYGAGARIYGEGAQRAYSVIPESDAVDRQRTRTVAPEADESTTEP